MLDASLAIISKDRPTHSVAEVIDVIGAEKVRGRVAIISDDMIDTAGTLCAGAEAVKRAGAARVIACATHPIFSPPALERIDQQRARPGRRVRHRAGRSGRRGRRR